MDSNLGGAQTIKKRLAEGIHPSEVKRKIPELEEKVKNLLLNAGFQEKESLEDISSHVHFLHNKRLPDHSGRPEDYRKPDFCWPLAKIILEVDDTYHEHADQQAKDAERNRIYESFGYEVFCVSEMSDWESAKEALDKLTALHKASFPMAPQSLIPGRRHRPRLANPK